MGNNRIKHAINLSLAPYRDEDLVAGTLKVRGYFCVPTSRVRLFSADQAIDLRVVDRLRSNREAEEKFNLSKDHARRMLAKCWPPSKSTSNLASGTIPMAGWGS